MSKKTPSALPDNQPLELDQLKKQVSTTSKSSTDKGKKQSEDSNSVQNEDERPKSRQRVLKLLLLNLLSLGVITTIYWNFFLPSKPQQENQKDDSITSNAEGNVPSEMAVAFPIIDMSGKNASTGEKLFTDDAKSEVPSKPPSESVSSLLAGLETPAPKQTNNNSPETKTSPAPSKKELSKNKPPKFGGSLISDLEPILITDYSLLELSPQSDSFEISNNEKYLMVGGLDGIGYLWDLETKKNIERFSQVESEITCLSFLPNSTKVLVGYTDQVVRLFEIGVSEKVIELKGHKSPLVHIKVLDEKHVATIDQIGFVHIWDLATFKSIKSFSCNSHITQTFSSPSNNSLYLASWGNQVSLWDWKAGAFQKELPMMGGAVSTQPIGVAQESIISLDTAGLVQFWNANSNALTRSFSIKIPHRSIVALSQNGKDLVAGAPDGSISLFNLETGLQTHQLQLQENSKDRRPVSLLISEMGNIAVSINANGVARVWKITRP